MDELAAIERIERALQRNNSFLQDPEMTSVYIMGEDDEEMQPIDLYRKMAMIDVPEYANNRVPVAKTVDGSRQSAQELGDSNIGSISPTGMTLVEPPYDPVCLKEYMKYDAVNYRCIKAKVTDSVLRSFELDPVYPVIADEENEDVDNPDALKKEDILAIEKEVSKFLRNINDTLDFESLLERAAMDFETVGWAALEVLRSPDMKVRRIAHVPAERIRVALDWKYFVEITANVGENYHYYQPFGQRIISKRSLPGFPEYYDPEEDGELAPTNKQIRWNNISYKTGEPTQNVEEAANEILWIPKSSNATIYYGLPDHVCCLADILANVNIRQYLIDFFEYNTIPRYAIIIEGGDFSPEVKKLIQEYFRTHIKGSAHKTMILPIKSVGQVKIRFEKLGSDVMEASFMETRKANNQQIMTAHGVSAAIIGINETASLGSGKGGAQAELYRDRIVAPMQRLWSRKMTKLIQCGLGIKDVCFKFKTLDIKDYKDEANYLKIFSSIGAMSLNEVRRKIGLKPMQGGDRPFITLPGGIEFVNNLDQAVSSSQERLMRNPASTSPTNSTDSGNQSTPAINSTEGK